MEALGDSKTVQLVQLVQVGVRNISAEGDRFRKSQGTRVRTFWAEDLLADRRGAWLEEVAGLVSGRDVYLSFDLDGLDSSIMPSTGTPEPGGLLWEHAVALLEKLANSSRIVAADLVELAPRPGLDAPAFLAATLGYLIVRRARGK